MVEQRNRTKQQDGFSISIHDSFISETTPEVKSLGKSL